MCKNEFPNIFLSNPEWSFQLIFLTQSKLSGGRKWPPTLSQHHQLLHLECPNPHFKTDKKFFPTQIILKTHNHTVKSPWLGSTSRVTLHSYNLRPFIQKHRPIKATVIFSLPTSNSKRVASAEKVPKWSAKAIKSLEARKFKYPTTGTEALIMGILIEGTNFASKFLWANGITLLKVREEIVKLVGRADMYYFSPEHPPFTEDAQRAIDWAIDEKLKSGDGGEVITTHLLLGVWSQEESPGHKILAVFGFNSEKAKELKSVITEPGFVDD